VSLPRHQASAAALSLIKAFEGYRPEAVALPGGRWVIGHGHTLTAREGAEVSEEDAETLLIFDLLAVAEAIEQLVFAPLNQNQLDALASFVFNIGVDNFRQSAVLRRLNEGAMLEAAAAIEAWRWADIGAERIVVDVLVRRRAAEKALFLTPPDGWIPAPGPMVTPMEGSSPDGLEPETAELSPSQRAAANLSARLKVLVPDPAEDGEALPAFDVAPDPFAAAIAQVEPLGAAMEEPQPFGGGDPRPDMSVGALIRPILHEPAPPKPDLRRRLYGDPEAKSKPPLSAFRRHVALGAAGLIAFTIAMVWAVHMPARAGPQSSTNIGVVLVGLIGVACVACAVYLALEKRAALED
jgi:lysozyme